MSTQQVDVGQVWVPKNPGPGVDLVRVVCRYPFPHAGDDAAWIVERVSAVHKLERVPETTLRDLWMLSFVTPLE